MVIILNDFVCSKNIRYLREKYRVSRRALSRLVGISLCTLRDYEEERVIPVFTHRQLLPSNNVSAYSIVCSEIV